MRHPMSGCNEPQRSTDDAHNSFSPEDGFVLLPPPICTSVMLAARVQRNRRVSSTRASYRSRVRRAPRVCAAASPGLGSHVVLYSPVFAYRPLPDATARPGPRPRRTAEADPHANHSPRLSSPPNRPPPPATGRGPRRRGARPFRRFVHSLNRPECRRRRDGTHNASQVALQMRNVRRTTT